MSKNLTRKGLALGAVVALGTTLFAGAPAFAANELTLASKSGSNLKTIEGETFALTAGVASGASSANIGYLKYQVVSTGTFTVDTVRGATTDAGRTAVTPVGGTQPTNTQVYAPASAPVVGAYQGVQLTSPTTIVAGTPLTAAVTAFFDTNSNGLLDSGEFSSPSVTVTWVDLADVAATTSFTAPTAGATTLDAYLTLPGINTEQLPATHVAVEVSNNVHGAPGTAVATGAPKVVAGGTLQTDGTFKFSASSLTSIDADDVISVTGTYLNGTATGFIAASTTGSSSTTALTVASTTGFIVGAPVYDDGTLVQTSASATVTISAIGSATGATLSGTPASAIGASSVVKVGTDAKVGTTTVKAAIARTLNSISVSAVAANGVKTTTAGVRDVATSGNEAAGVAIVRSDVTAFDVLATFKDANGAVIKGAEVTANVTSGNLATDASDGVTVNTKAVDSDTAAAVTGLVTDANGQVKLSFAATAADATDNVIVNFTAQNYSTGSSSGETTITWTAASYLAYAMNSNGNVASTTDGAAVSIPVLVADQWGSAPAAGYDVLATFDSADGSYSAQATTASTSASETKAALVDGKATLTITDNGTGAGVNVYDISVQKLTGNTYGTAIATIANFKINIKAAADITVGSINFTDSLGTLNATSKVYEVTTAEPQAKTTFGSNDARTRAGVAPTGFATDSEANFVGNVKTAATLTTAAATIAGAKVTFKGAGLQFKSTIDSAAVYATDELTVYTNASGVWDVNVYSNKAGTRTFTITSGSVTQTVTVVVAASANDSGKTLTVTAPSTIKAGRTLTITGLLVDAYGNPVAAVENVNSDGAGSGKTRFSVTYDGPGYVLNTPTSTDANGKFSIRVLLGADEVGLAGLTVTYDPDDAVADNTVTKTTSTLIGVSATASAAKKAAAVSVKNAAGLTVKVVSGTKSVTKVATSDSYKVSLTKLTAGKKTVKVYVEGILVLSKSVTVKK